MTANEKTQNKVADDKERLSAVNESTFARAFFFVSSISVSYKIAGALVIILTLAIASLGVATFSRQKQILEQEMKKRAEVLVRQLATAGKEGLLTKEELPVFSTIKDIQKDPMVAYAMVLDSQGKVFVHNLLESKGITLSGGADQESLRSSELLFQKIDYIGETVLDASLPIISKAKNIRIGTSRIGLSEKELREAIKQQKIVFCMIAAIFVAVGLLISFGLARVLTRPIYNLAAAMQAVSQGDLSQQAKVFYKDEIGKLTEAFNQMILSLREKLHMEKYLSHTTLRSIKKNIDTTALKLGGERKQVTALFSDVCDFTSMSEKMSPEEVVDMLNIYLNLQSKVVHQRLGVVDKFIGDEVMAIFEGEGQEINAVCAAYEIQRYAQVLSQARLKAGKKLMKLGIGINSGEVIMGNMGSEEHMDYTVIGDTINLAARLCSAAQEGQIVISGAVANKVDRLSKLKKLDPVLVKGKDSPIEIYEVLDVSRAARRYMRRLINLECSYRLAGLASETNFATVKNLGPLGCLLEVDVPVGIGSRLDVEIRLKALQYILKTSAVVKQARKIEFKYVAGVHFEEINEDEKNQIIEWVHQIETEPVPAASI